MVYYDECKFSAGVEGKTIKKNKLKEWSNTYVPIEMKGVDARNKDIFCSAIIATNNNTDVHLEPLDRKFSAMELTEERLEKRLGLETTQFLWECIKEPSFPDAFINYLEPIIDPEFNTQIEYKGPKFHELVVSSLNVWKSNLRTILLNENLDSLDPKTLKDQIPTLPNPEIKDFLTNFLEKGESLGSVEFKDGQYLIIPSEKYRATKNNMELTDE